MGRADQPGSFRYPNAARASGLIVGFAAPGPAELRAAFAALDLLLLNRHEAQAITGTRTLAAAAVALRRVFTGGVNIERADPLGALPGKAKSRDPFGWRDFALKWSGRRDSNSRVATPQRILLNP